MRKIQHVLNILIRSLCDSIDKAIYLLERLQRDEGKSAGQSYRRVIILQTLSGVFDCVVLTMWLMIMKKRSNMDGLTYSKDLQKKRHVENKSFNAICN